MTEAWKTWEGQTVGGFALQKYLGGSDHSAVYLTQLSNGAQKAVIKFIPADAGSDVRLASWRVAGELTHPHALQLIRMGRCRLAETNLLYVVMEFAEEDLSQILPQRPLEPEEARQLLQSIVNALKYLHRQGLAHTRLKPSNILAIGDQLKISSDTLCEMGSKPIDAPGSIYAAPESASSPVSTAGDIWALGATLVEALTQHVPVVRNQTTVEIPASETIPPPFLEIARRSLEVDPARRASLQQITGLLNPDQAATRESAPTSSAMPAPSVPAPVAVAPAESSPTATSSAATSPAATSPATTAPASPAISPAVFGTSILSPPISTIETPKKSLASQQPSLLPRTLTSGAVLRGSSLTEAAAAAPKRKSRIAIPIIAVLVVLGAILAAPRVLNRFSQLQPQASVVEPSTASAPSNLEPPKLPKQQADTDASSQNSGELAQDSLDAGRSGNTSGKAPAGKQAGGDRGLDWNREADTSDTTRDKRNTIASGANDRDTTASNASGRELTASRRETSSARASKSAKSVKAEDANKEVTTKPERGAVLFQVVPDVSQRARSTIRGTVRVSLKLHVDPAGDVTGTDLVSDGSSKFFADQAVKVANRWTFTPPEVDGRAVPSEWELRFEFTTKDTKVFPTQVSP
ncbi:MAG: protein kinase [Acidobacteriota bacterium]|nr:protein kinase [Acidobacteriota bacterium]